MVNNSDDRFDRLAEQHKDAIYRQMLRLCGNHDQAEDVLVQALLKAYHAMDQLSDPEAFRAWLAQIARRTCGRLKLQESAHPLLSLSRLEDGERLPATATTADESLIEQETKRCLLDAFKTLKAPYAEVFKLRDLEGLSAEETAANLGISIAAVKSRLHRARKELRDRLEVALTDDFVEKNVDSTRV